MYLRLTPNLLFFLPDFMLYAVRQTFMKPTPKMSKMLWLTVEQ
jgi:hypothetical protein